MSKFRRFVAQAVFFVFIVIVGTWTINRFARLMDLSLFTAASPEKKFMTAWQADITRLDSAHSLPNGFKDLKKVGFTCSSERLKKAFDKYPLTLERNPQGKFNLEIFADEVEGGSVVVQYDLVDVKSGNTVWELGRTFPQTLEAKSNEARSNEAKSNEAKSAVPKPVPAQASSPAPVK